MEKIRFGKFINILLVSGITCCGMLNAAVPVPGIAPPEENIKPHSGKRIVPPSEEESPANAPAQFYYGVYCLEHPNLNRIEEGYKFLELAAKQNYRDAWIVLSDAYLKRRDEDESYLLWAILCCKAAERLKVDARTEFNIGALEGLRGNMDEFRKWMELAAKKGYDEAVNILKDEEVKKYIAGVAEQKKKKKAKSALRQAVDSHMDKMRELTGTTAREVMDQLAGRSSVSRISKMIVVPVQEKYLIKKWTYDPDAVDEYVSSHLMADRDGGTRWMTEEFFTQPIWDNLLYPNPTVRAINASYDDALEEFLSKSGFRLCNAEETAKFIKPFRYENDDLENYEDDRIWDLGNDLYFRIHISSGAWRLRDYQFFCVRNGEILDVVTYPAPPSAADAALAAGAAQGDHDCLNDLAVKFADGEMDQVCRRDDEAEEILTILADKDHLIGTYNLGVFYQNRNDEANARKYFEKAEKLAGKSVISYSVHLPEIFDRNGELLVKNSFFRKRHSSGRVYTRGGKFAASLIGHVSTREYNFNGPQPAGREIFSERDGVEYMIIKKNICHPVYLTIDATLQSRLEKLITDIDAKSTPMYAYGVIVSSKGELIAAAQNIVFDLEKRDFRNIDEWNFNFMPSGYVFPVADQWMKLLNSSSYAAPLSKEKLKLHIKQGVFQGEAQGVVLGLNRMKGNSDPNQVSGQTATMLNYICAYIGVAEKKEIPQLSVYTDKVNSLIVPKSDIKWISFYRPADGIVVNALGVIKSSNSKEDLYICIRAVGVERNFKKPAAEGVKKAAKAKMDIAEKIIREFSIK